MPVTVKTENVIGTNQSDLFSFDDGSVGQNCEHIRFLEHGAPSQLMRWHHHQEYELHLITQTSGQAFIGDYIGEFEPGNLVLIGPYLPHNWVSRSLPDEGVKIRDKILHFSDKPLRKTSLIFPELHELMPLLERAKYGIEFENISYSVEKSLDKIAGSSGMKRLAEFLQLLHTLLNHPYRLLSSMPYHNVKGGSYFHRIEKAIDFVSLNYDSLISMKEVAEYVNMTVNCFSRDFRRATGKTFTDYMNHLRVAHACELLMSTEDYISTICYKVGFNNVANFNRRFLEIRGVTPSDFRRENERKINAGSFKNSSNT